MIQLLTGENTFTRQEAYLTICRDHDSDGSLAANTVTLEGKTLTLAELAVVVRALPFLSDYRLVRVNGLCERFSGRSKNRRRSVAEWDGLSDLLETLPNTTLLIFLDGKTDNRNPIRRVISQIGEIREFPVFRDRAVEPWVHDRARDLGIHLTSRAGRQLVAQVGHDLWALAAELQKIEIYANGSTVDDELIAILSPINHEANIFQLVDAVAEGRIASAMGALCVLREAGETPQRIMHMLARQIRMIAIVRNLIDNGADDNTIRKNLDVHDFVARRVIKQARRYSQSSVDSALECLLACDIAIQNYRNDRPGAMGAEEALDLLVVDLAG